MSAESTEPQTRAGHARVTFQHWRWGRPFWAGLLTLLAGAPIAYFPYHNITFGQLSMRVGTTAGAASLIISVLLVTLGLTMWFQPAVRVFAGVASIMLALVSLPLSNMGGIVVGFLLALIGGALSVSWMPGVPVADDPGEQAELPPAAPDSGGDGAEPGRGAPNVPPQGAGPDATADPYAKAEPVHAGGRTDEETTEENGRHRAG